MKQLYAKYVNDNAGREDEREEVKELFIFHQFYPVEKIDMGQSHTNVTLKGFKGVFNSVFFEFLFYDTQTGIWIPHDIFADPDYNPYIKRKEYTFTGKDGDVNKDEVRTMMSVANGLKEEYERKLEEFELELNKKSMEYHNKWLENLLKTNIKVGDVVYKVFQSGCDNLKCPYCQSGQVEVKLKDRVEWVQCPICKGWKPQLYKYDYKKVKVKVLQITLRTDDKNKKVSPYVDTWTDIPDYEFDKVECKWNIKDDNYDNLTSDRTAKTEEEAKEIIENLKKKNIAELEEKYGKENVKEMLKPLGI